MEIWPYLWNKVKIRFLHFFCTVYTIVWAACYSWRWRTFEGSPSSRGGTVLTSLEHWCTVAFARGAQGIEVSENTPHLPTSAINQNFLHKGLPWTASIPKYFVKTYPWWWFLAVVAISIFFARTPPTKSFLGFWLCPCCTYYHLCARWGIFWLGKDVRVRKLCMKLLEITGLIHALKAELVQMFHTGFDIFSQYSQLSPCGATWQWLAVGFYSTTGGE